MNDTDKPANKAPKKAALSRKRSTAEKAAPISVPVVPRVPEVAPDNSQRDLVLSLGVLTTILTLVTGSVVWFSDRGVHFTGEPAQAPGLVSASYPTDPLAAHVRENLKQELRLATLALEMRENQVRLSEETQALAGTVEALASRIGRLKSDGGAAQIHASTAHTREEGVLEVKDPYVSEPVLLGEPALREETRPVYHSTAESSELVQPVTTGAVPEVSSPPQAAVLVAANNGKPPPKQNTIKGWRVHSADADLATVASKDVYYQVRTGHVIPGAGTVRAIQKRGDQWVVLTSKGLISEAR
jgi:hypothetical protein